MEIVPRLLRMEGPTNTFILEWIHFKSLNTTQETSVVLYLPTPYPSRPIIFEDHFTQSDGSELWYGSTLLGVLSQSSVLVCEVESMKGSPVGSFDWTESRSHVFRHKTLCVNYYCVGGNPTKTGICMNTFTDRMSPTIFII